MRIRSTRARVAAFVATAAVLAALVAGVAGPAGSAQAASGRRAIAHTQPAWLVHATKLGHASPSAAVQARGYLAPSGGMAPLEQIPLAGSTPGTPPHPPFLPPGQYFQRLGTPPPPLAGVRAWVHGPRL